MNGRPRPPPEGKKGPPRATFRALDDLKGPSPSRRANLGSTKPPPLVRSGAPQQRRRLLVRAAGARRRSEGLA
eukprot:scaffold2220_cov377-Prasinococcus_capsulatus_cf.AAC.5